VQAWLAQVQLGQPLPVLEPQALRLQGQPAQEPPGFQLLRVPLAPERTGLLWPERVQKEPLLLPVQER
jgi:hypothetical protein